MILNYCQVRTSKTDHEDDCDEKTHAHHNGKGKQQVCVDIEGKLFVDQNIISADKITY
jgi:hypothetical protein